MYVYSEKAGQESNDSHKLLLWDSYNNILALHKWKC